MSINANMNTKDKKIAAQKKNAMAIFGALLLQAPTGRTYKVKLPDRRIDRHRLLTYLEIANRECETNAELVMNDLGHLAKIDDCVLVQL